MPSFFLCSIKYTMKQVYHSPDAHAVHEGVGAVRRPDTTVLLEHCDVPHELVHDLRELDRVRGRAGTASARSGTAISDVILVVRAVEVLAIPTSREGMISLLFISCSHVERVIGCLGTYAGKMMVCRIIWQFDPLGTSTVSEPVHGAPPTNWSSFGEVQQR